MPPGPTATPIELTADERSQLQALVRKATSPQRAVTRANIVLLADEGTPNTAIAEELHISRTTVVKWRNRFAENGLDGLEDLPRSGCPPTFTDADRAVVYAIACKLPHEHDLPLSRLGSGEVHAVANQLLDPCPSRTTIQEWLADASIKPWTQSSWVTPMDPDFLEKATPALDLYEGKWKGERLGKNDVVICADEKTGLQALKREVDRPASAGRRQLVETTYSREGTIIYQAALFVRGGGVHGHVVDRNTRKHFEELVEEVMDSPRCEEADRVFWVVDIGGAHHPATFGEWLEKTYPKAVCVHLPVHASWLNQIELYFSVLGRKALAGTDVADTDELAERVLGFERWWSQDAEPFKWTFSANDLDDLLARVPSMA